MLYDSTGTHSVGEFLLKFEVSAPARSGGLHPTASENAQMHLHRTAEIIARLQHAHALCEETILEKSSIVDIPAGLAGVDEADQTPVTPLPSAVTSKHVPWRPSIVFSLISFLCAMGGFAWIMLNVPIGQPTRAARAATQSPVQPLASSFTLAEPPDQALFTAFNDEDAQQTRYDADLLLEDIDDPVHLLFGYEVEEVVPRIIPAAEFVTFTLPEPGDWELLGIGLPGDDIIFPTTPHEMPIPETISTIAPPAGGTASRRLKTLDDVLTWIRVAVAMAGFDVFKPAPVEPPAPRVTVGRATFRELNIPGRRGVEIRFALRVEEFAGHDLEVGAYFFTADGRPVRDRDNQYVSQRRNAYAKRIVAIEETRFDEQQFTLFMPYVQFDGLPGGRHLLVTQVVVWSGAKFDHRMASGRKQTFTTTLYKFANADM